MFRFALVAAVLCLVLASCGGKAVPDSTEVAVAVAATLTASAPTAVQPPSDTAVAASTSPASPTRLEKETSAAEPALPPTDTPSSVARTSPTAKATLAAAPTVAVPAGWKRYEDIVGRFSFWRPPGWELDDQRAGWVAFVLEAYALVGVKMEPNADVSPRGEDDESSLNSLVERAAGRPGQLQFRVLDKGLWDDSGFFVMHTAKVASLDTTEYTLEVAIPVGSGNVATLVCGKAFNPMPDAWIKDFHVLLATLDVPGGTIRRATPVPSPTRAPGDAPTGTVNRPCNLRQGPGTNYATIGSAKAGDVIELLGRNEAADWLYIRAEERPVWIASFLVDNGNFGELPVRQSTAPTVAPAQPTAPPVPSIGVGDEVEVAGWRFKVSDLHKRKAVYFYDWSFVAQGRFLVVIIDATNIQSGTDYFANNLATAVVDTSGAKHMPSPTGTRYARWQFGGLTDVFDYVNPGNFARIALAYDLPDHLGDVALVTPLGRRIHLGNFNAMQSEDD